MDSKYDEEVPSDYRWTPGMVQKQFPGNMASCQVTFGLLTRKDIGLVLDLTKTSRYYDAEALGTDCKVVKIECAG